MLRSGVVFAVSLAIAATLPFAAGAETPPPVPAVVVKTMTAIVTVEPDGSYTAIGHVEKLATNESAARTIAQYTVEYSETMDTVEIVEAYTKKADGRVLQVDPTQIFAQAPPGSPRVPMFNDHKQKIVVFPDVAGDDTVVYTVKRTYQPRFAGQFFANGVFARSFAVEDFRVSITLPKAMVAHVEARGVDHRVADAAAAGRRARGALAVGHRSAIPDLDVRGLCRGGGRLSHRRGRQGGGDAARPGGGRPDHGGDFRSAGRGAPHL